jgi:hypothetical protein
MKTTLLKRARKLWNSDLATPEMNRMNQLKWAQAVQRLGDKWLLAQFITKQHDNNYGISMPRMRHMDRS